MAFSQYSDAFVTVDDDGQVTFTEAGIKKYRSYFGRAGIDIRQVTNYRAYLHAKRLIRPLEIGDLEQTVKASGKNNSLENRLLDAIINGDTLEEQRLAEKLAAKKRMGLHVID